MADFSTLNSTDVPRNAKSPSCNPNNKAELLRKLHNIIELTAEVDLEKVKEYKDAIEQGRYQINPKNIACKILDFESELSE